MQTRPRLLPKIADQANIEVSAILLHIAQEWTAALSDEQLYERARRYWLCDPDSQPVRPTHAIAYAAGRVRGVYKIDTWITYNCWPDDRDLTRKQGRNDPWDDGTRKRGFIGAPDPQLQHLVNKSVMHLQQIGGRNPFFYLNCGR